MTKTRRALSRAHLLPTIVFQRRKTMQRRAPNTHAQYMYVGFSQRNKIPRCNANDIGESNPVPASGL